MISIALREPTTAMVFSIGHRPVVDQVDRSSSGSLSRTVLTATGHARRGDAEAATDIGGGSTRRRPRATDGGPLGVGA
jgi:hypothetical protein